MFANSPKKLMVSLGLLPVLIKLPHYLDKC